MYQLSKPNCIALLNEVIQLYMSQLRVVRRNNTRLIYNFGCLLIIWSQLNSNYYGTYLQLCHYDNGEFP